MWDALPEQNKSEYNQVYFLKNPIVTGKNENKGWDVGLVQGIKRKKKKKRMKGKGNEKKTPELVLV